MLLVDAERERGAATKGGRPGNIAWSMEGKRPMWLHGKVVGMIDMHAIARIDEST